MLRARVIFNSRAAGLSRLAGFRIWPSLRFLLVRIPRSLRSHSGKYTSLIRKRKFGSNPKAHAGYIIAQFFTRSMLRTRVIFNSRAAGFSQSIGLVGNRDDIDYSKCGNTYWGYACCRKAELLYPNTNEGRQDWSDTGAVEYVK